MICNDFQLWVATKNEWIFHKQFQRDLYMTSISIYTTATLWIRGQEIFTIVNINNKPKSVCSHCPRFGIRLKCFFSFFDFLVSTQNKIQAIHQVRNRCLKKQKRYCTSVNRDLTLNAAVWECEAFRQVILTKLSSVCVCVQLYTDCRCVSGTRTEARPTPCPNSCTHLLIPVIVLISVASLIACFTHNPLYMMVLR